MNDAVWDRHQGALRRQTALAGFGELALRSENVDEILTEGCRLVAEALGTDLAKIMELRPDGKTLLVRAGVGWKLGVIGEMTIRVADDTSEGHALKTGELVISSDITTETRFRYPSFLTENDVKAFASVVIIGGQGRPSFGVLQVDSRWPRAFTDEDTALLRGYANLIAAAVDRLRVLGKAREGEARLRVGAERQRAALKTGLIGFFEWDTPARTITADEHFAGFCGFDPAATAAGVPLVDLVARIHPEDRIAVVERVEASLASTADYADEFRVVHADGTVRWVQMRGHCTEQANGRPLRCTGTAADVTAAKAAGAALRESEARFRHMADSAPALIWMSDEAGQVVFANRRYEHVFARRAATMLGQGWERDVLAEDLPGYREAFRGAFRARRAFRAEARVRDRDGQVRWLRCEAVPRLDDVGRFLGYTGCAVDVTEAKFAADALEARVDARTAALRQAVEALHAEAWERAQAEEALRQAQKMEAVGQLTGGLAHDFNNLLAGITGSLELMRTRAAQGRTAEFGRYLEVALTSANRAAALTHRLLAFSRRQTLDPKPTDTNRLVLGMADLVRRTAGPAIVVETRLAHDLWSTLCDPNQLESALLNLAINARDAMPDGGCLVIETANAVLPDRRGASGNAQARTVPPGEYMTLSVADTGVGMAPDVMSRAFDPFFTTKPIGQGTGLGLSMIYGFAQQSGGHVRLRSAPGRGTTATLYLPRHLGVAMDGEAEGAVVHPAVRAAEASAVVLVVEDEPAVRMVAVDVLSDLGYAVLEAEDGRAGLRVVESGAHIDLLLTDVGLPGGMNGRQLADAARVRRPDLKVLFVTGYAESAAVGNGLLQAGMEVMTKPFAVHALAARVQSIVCG